MYFHEFSFMSKQWGSMLTLWGRHNFRLMVQSEVVHLLQNGEGQIQHQKLIFFYKNKTSTRRNKKVKTKYNKNNDKNYIKQVKNVY